MTSFSGKLDPRESLVYSRGKEVRGKCARHARAMIACLINWLQEIRGKSTKSSIKAYVGGQPRDVLMVAPTGTGKSQHSDIAPFVLDLKRGEQSAS